MTLSPTTLYYKLTGELKTGKTYTKKNTSKTTNTIRKPLSNCLPSRCKFNIPVFTWSF